MCKNSWREWPKDCFNFSLELVETGFVSLERLIDFGSLFSDHVILGVTDALDETLAEHHLDVLFVLRLFLSLGGSLFLLADDGILNDLLQLRYFSGFPVLYQELHDDIFKLLRQLGCSHGLVTDKCRTVRHINLVPNMDKVQNLVTLELHKHLILD